MLEIKDFGVSEGLRGSHFYGIEEELLKDEGLIKLKQVYDHLMAEGYCHVRVKGGDYDGSIAKFTLDTEEKYEKLYFRSWGDKLSFIVKRYWLGRLSWKGKRNNPAFTIKPSNCDIILDYEGEEVLKRFDLKKEGKKLLEKDTYDIDFNKLSIGDKVLYLNLRYGQGGCLCHGIVKDFKAHARDGYVSVIIKNIDSAEESECRQPYNQIYKL